jgi:hypothetical protein
MPHMKLLSLCAALALGASVSAQTNSSALGSVTCSSHFRLDGSEIFGNSTLFDGARLEAGQAPLRLLLHRGVQLQLAPGAAGTVYHDRFLLERGEGRLLRSTGFRLEARGLRVLPASPDSSVRVLLPADDRLWVIALNGPVRVTSAAGLELANLPPRSGLEFQPQPAGAAAPWVLTGTLKRQNGRYFLQDETSGVIAELQGPDLDKYVGSRVEVTAAAIPGATPAVKGASQVLLVTAIKRLAAGRAAAAAGMAARSKAIIAGVIIGGVATGVSLAVAAGPPKAPYSP